MLPYARTNRTTRNAALLFRGDVERAFLECGFSELWTIRLRSNLCIVMELRLQLPSASRFGKSSPRVADGFLTLYTNARRHRVVGVASVRVRRLPTNHARQARDARQDQPLRAARWRSTHQGKRVSGQPINPPQPMACAVGGGGLTRLAMYNAASSRTSAANPYRPM